MKKFKIIVFIAFFTCFIPSVKSEEFVTVKSAQSYSTRFKITGTHTESSSTKSCRNSSSGSNDDSRGGGDNGGGGRRPSPGGGGPSLNCNTTNSTTTVNKNSGWQNLQSEGSYTFSLPDIGIEAGDTYTVNYDVESGGNGYCGLENMTRGADETTDYYTMQNTVSNASCGSGRR